MALETYKGQYKTKIPNIFIYNYMHQVIPEWINPEFDNQEQKVKMNRACIDIIYIILWYIFNNDTKNHNSIHLNLIIV